MTKQEMLDFEPLYYSYKVYIYQDVKGYWVSRWETYKDGNYVIEFISDPDKSGNYERLLHIFRTNAIFAIIPYGYLIQIEQDGKYIYYKTIMHPVRFAIKYEEDV